MIVFWVNFKKCASKLGCFVKETYVQHHIIFTCIDNVFMCCYVWHIVKIFIIKNEVKLWEVYRQTYKRALNSCINIVLGHVINFEHTGWAYIQCVHNLCIFSLMFPLEIGDAPFSIKSQIWSQHIHVNVRTSKRHHRFLRD